MIVVALSETIRLMKQIDIVIADHGGWPGAFLAGMSKGMDGGEHLLKVAEPEGAYVARREKINK
jgi:hypothetical protein